MRLVPIALLLMVPLLAACVVRSNNNHNNNNNSNNNNPGSQPLTVVVDTDQTIKDTPGGEGVGIFVQYAAGGHWHVWWTCDTNKSGLPCDFVVTANGSGIANAKATAFATADTLDSTNARVVATTHTTDGLATIDFDATPGTDVTIDVAVSGLRDGNFFFWVGDDANGKPAINGGYTGQLTDPLVFSPSTP